MAEAYVVVHFASTFDGVAVHVPRDSRELLALSWCIVDVKTLETLPRQCILVKPLNTPVTRDCILRYNISWDDVEEGRTFKEAIADFDRKLTEQLAGRDFSFVTVDVDNIRVFLPREARDKVVALPGYMQHPRVFDLCNEYRKWQVEHPESLSYPCCSMGNIITALGIDLALPWSENTGHYAELAVGIYAQILVQLVKRSVPVEAHKAVLTTPYDSALDAQVFLAERSKILYLSNLSADTTHSELESWFTQSSGRPIAFWALKSAHLGDSKSNLHTGPYPQPKSVSGFAIFARHEDAADALYMHGRVLMENVVEVQASSMRVLDRALKILTSFPQLKNKPRPGDWTCPSCGFSNFQRRIACLRCSFLAVSVLAILDQTYTSPGNPSREPVLNSDIANMTSTNNITNMRKHKADDRQVLSGTGTGGYLDLYTGAMNGPKSTGAYSNGYTYNHSHSGNNPRTHYGNQVPFRAGDWTCSNESCQYHNFAKNFCCLKCGASKPPSDMHNAAPNNNINSTSNSVNNNGHPASGAYSSVNFTAAAIAAATASDQPLNLNSNFFRLQLPVLHHSRQNGNVNTPSASASSLSSSLPIHNTGLYANISHLQQLQFQQGTGHSNAQLLQHLAVLQGHGQVQNQGQLQGQNSLQKSQGRQTLPAGNPAGLYVQHGSSAYQSHRDFNDGASNSAGISSLSSHMGSMSLDK